MSIDGSDATPEGLDIRGAIPPTLETRVEFIDALASLVPLATTTNIKSETAEEHTRHNIVQDFNNGVTIAGFWEDNAIADPQRESDIISSLGVFDPDQTRYLYTFHKGGEERLELKKPGESPRTVAQQSEAIRQGVDNITDAKLSDFSKAIQGAVASGVQV